MSVSDDRTVRVWDVPADWKSLERYALSSCSGEMYRVHITGTSDPSRARVP